MASMLAWVGGAVVAAGVLWLLGALGGRVRRRGGGASDAALGPFEEMWHPAAHRARLATEVVEERMVAPPGADDRPDSGG